MSKLPTAYQTLNHHLSRVGLTLTTAHESILLDAIESHTVAHTAALRERVKELENELKLSEDTIKHQAERCLKLEAKLTRLDKECEYLSAENTDLSYQIEGKKQDNKFLVKKMTELKAENTRYRDRIGEALKFLHLRQQTTPGLGAPVTILKQALEK